MKAAWRKKNYMSNIVRKTGIWVCILMFIVQTLAHGSICFASEINESQSQAEQTNKQVVKVGYMLSPGFQEGGEGEYKTGQGYEYLQKISGYTGWTYEYVYGDFTELLQKLSDGEIDIMGNLSYSNERAKSISFGKYEQGRENFYLYVNGNSSHISGLDYSTLNGKKIGVTKGTYLEDVWNNWCMENNVECDIVYFLTTKEREDALNNGEIDATLGSLLTTNSKETVHWKNIINVGEAPYYFGVNKEKPELLDELNDAQAKILSEDPYYNDVLNSKYISSGFLVQTQLSDSEKQWLEDHNNTMKIGCLNNYLPISDVDNDGQIVGVLPDVLSAIEENFAEYDIHFEKIVYTDYQNMISDLKNGTIDIAAPVFGDYWNADREGICLTNSFVSTTMLLLQKGGYALNTVKKIGVDMQSPTQSVYAKIYYPNCEVVSYPDMESVA